MDEDVYKTNLLSEAWASSSDGEKHSPIQPWCYIHSEYESFLFIYLAKEKDFEKLTLDWKRVKQNAFVLHPVAGTGIQSERYFPVCFYLSFISRHQVLLLKTEIVT